MLSHESVEQDDCATATKSAAEIAVPVSSQTAPLLSPGTQTSRVDAKAIVVPGSEKGGKGGEGGRTTAFAAFTPTNAVFLEAIFLEAPAGSQPIVAVKPNDPQEGGWIAKPASAIHGLTSASHNTYFNCSSVLPGEDGVLTARKDSAAAYHALVLDDVGTKVDRSLLGTIMPTWELETSPGNYQIGFKLSPPLRDPQEVDLLQQKVAAAGLTDTGALGMVRWARLPNGINGKPKYMKDGKPFTCRLSVWNPGAAFTAGELIGMLAPQVSIEKIAPVTAKVTSRKSDASNLVSDLYQPRAAENPVIGAFKVRGLYKHEIAPGKHEVTCPWLEEHTDQLDTGAAYFEPDDSHPGGGFCCQHSHKDKYHIRQVLDQFELTGSQARNRPVIRTMQGEIKGIVEAAEEVLTLQGDLYHAGGVIVKAGRDPMTGDWAVRPVGEPELTLILADASDWEKYDKRSNGWERCDPPQRHVNMIYRAQNFERLPLLKGLARQPYYREQDEQLVGVPGYDRVSQRLGVFDAAKFPPVGNSEADARKSLAQLRELVSEFRFADPVDEAAVICAILTAATRPALDLAPAFHVKAPASGSGKSYLCEVISLFAGPGSPARMSYPKTSEEATKAIMAALLTSPAVIEFDDMDTDWLPHGVINRMLTSRTITDRLLGFSKTATVSTNALILGSGNNVGPVRDLLRRVITINLNTRTSLPGTIAYKGNPVATLRANRERYVIAALTIIEAWKAAGCPKASVASIASYGGSWAGYCRHPLIWLGLPDPATSLLEQMRSDPDAEQLETLLTEWHRKHGDKPITLRRLISDAYATELQEALQDLPVVERGAINNSKLGWFFKRNMNRIVGGFMLEKVANSERNAWCVVKVGGETPSSPLSPPSPALVAATGQRDEVF